MGDPSEDRTVYCFTIKGELRVGGKYKAGELSCPFPEATLANYPKPGGFELLHLLSHSPGGQKSYNLVSAGLAPSGGSRREPVPGFLRLLEAICTPWLPAPPSVFRAISPVSDLCQGSDLTSSDPPSSLL